MEHKEQYFHSCPECGALSPWLQGECDCGYRFRRGRPKDRRLVVAVAVLSVLLVCSVGVIWYQHEVLPWKWAVNATPLLSEKYGEGYDAGYAAALAASEAPAETFSEWSDRKQQEQSAADSFTENYLREREASGLPPLTPSTTLPPLTGGD